MISTVDQLYQFWKLHPKPSSIAISCVEMEDLLFIFSSLIFDTRLSLTLDCPGILDKSQQSRNAMVYPFWWTTCWKTPSIAFAREPQSRRKGSQDKSILLVTACHKVISLDYWAQDLQSARSDESCYDENVDLKELHLIETVRWTMWINENLPIFITSIRRVSVPVPSSNLCDRRE